MSLLTGLKAYWSFNEGSGTDAFDSENSNDLTLSSSGVWDGGVLGDSVDLTGEETADGTPMITAYGGSLSLWVYPTSISVRKTMVCLGNTGNNNIFWVFWTRVFGNGDIAMQLRSGSGSETRIATATGVMNVNEWNHIVFANCTNDPTDLKIYHNGTSMSLSDDGSGAGSFPSFNTFSIGSLSRSSKSSFLNDKIDEVGWWDRELSSSEVLELYNSGAGLAYPFGAGAVARRPLFLGGGL